MESPQAIAMTDEAKGLPRHRVRFSTGTVKPTSLPSFAYVSTELLFDAIIYTAIAQAKDITKAENEIVKFWPDAVIRFIEVGQSSFKNEDQSIKSVYYGSYLARKQTSLFDKFRSLY